MRRDRDKSGASPVIGFVLVISLIVLTLSIYQVGVVPILGAEQEIESHQQIKGDMLSLEQAMFLTSTTNISQSVSFNNRIDYPPLSLIPLQPRANLSVTQEYPITIRAVSFDGDGNKIINYEEQVNNRYIYYDRPSYYYYTNAPMYYYENTVLTRTPNKSVKNSQSIVPLSSQQLINGDRITILTLENNYNRQTNRAFDISVLKNSASSDFAGTSSQYLNITMRTKLSEDDWRTILSDQFDDENGRITNIEYTEEDSMETNKIRVSLNGGTDYKILYRSISLS
jgi:hypothetical protein